MAHILMNGEKFTYEYDTRGNKISETDPLGNTTTYRYNEQNRVISGLSPTGASSTYAAASRSERNTTA